MKNRLTAAILLLLSATFLSGWRTYSDSIQIGDGVAADRNIEAKIGNSPTNPIIRWDNGGGFWALSNDGTTFRQIPEIPLDATEIADGSVTDTEFQFINTLTSNAQTQFDDITTAITLTPSRAVVSDGAGALDVSLVTSTEIGYLDGVTSAIQTQMDLKAPLASPAFTGIVTTDEYFLGAYFQPDPHTETADITIDSGEAILRFNWIIANGVTVTNNGTIYTVGTVTSVGTGTIIGTGSIISLDAGQNGDDVDFDGNIRFYGTVLMDNGLTVNNGLTASGSVDLGSGVTAATIATNGTSSCPNGGNLCQGTYSPTFLGNTGGCALPTGWSGRWHRDGNLVTVFASGDASGCGITDFLGYMTLPIATTFNSNSAAIGSGFVNFNTAVSYPGVIVRLETGTYNNRVEVKYMGETLIPGGGANTGIHFTYTIE